MTKQLLHCPIFRDMTEEDINQCLSCSGAVQRTYKPDQIVFHPLEVPQKLFVLLQGSVSVCKDSHTGNPTVLTTFEQPGEIFGEVYLFLAKNKYDYYALVNKESVVLELPKQFFYKPCSHACNHHTKLIFNMLSVLSGKAYFLNQKVDLLASSSLRQKIAKILLMKENGNSLVELSMSREQLAAYLNVARPSLSRELTKMAEEGLIELKGKNIRILDREELQQFE